MPRRPKPFTARLLALFLCLCLNAVSFCAAGVAMASPSLKSVTIMADSSMSMAVAEIARNYSRDRGIIVNTSFVAPGEQEAQINEGAAADILITPKQAWIDQLKTQGLVDVYSQTVVAKNRLALVGPLDSPIQTDLTRGFPTAAILQQLDGEPGVVVGNPETLIEGAYGKQALRNLGVAADLEPYTLYIRQLNQMFDMVVNQHAYGVFFYSSTVSRPGLRVLDVFPEDSHHPIVYYAVVIAGENMNEARKFIEYLKSTGVVKILRDNGFTTE